MIYDKNVEQFQFNKFTHKLTQFYGCASEA